MVSNFFLTDVLSDFPNFGGVYSNNQFLKIKLQENLSYIVNTNNQNQPYGGHWILITCFKSPKKIEIFDSLKIVNPPNKILDKCRKFNKIQYTKKSIQDKKSNYCGFFCLYRFLTLNLFLKPPCLSEFINLFKTSNKSKIFNDQLVLQYIKLLDT